MKYSKEVFEDLIFNQKLSYREIGRMYSISDTYVKKVAQKLGISLRKRSKFPDGFKPANFGKSKKKKPNCKHCGKEIELFGKIYCSIECQMIYKHKKKYEDFIVNNHLYCRDNYSPRLFKDKFLKDQDYKCDLCKIPNEWNGKKLVFVLDHIDGDASNNKRENLRLVCPNCDSQLPTFKSKNKNSARKNRYLKQKK